MSGNKKGSYANGSLPEELQEHAEEQVSQLPCKVCGRTFNSNILKRHEVMCQKQAKKKVKKFDMKNQRLDGVLESHDIYEMKRLGKKKAKAKAKP